MKILIVDDHALFRDGLSHVLMALEDDVEILHAANNETALELLPLHPDLDLLLLDLDLPGKDGFTTLEEISHDHPAVPVVIISGSHQRKNIQRALDAGALGYIPKESPSSVMISALKLILAGGIYIPPQLVEENSEQEALTPRQRQVLRLLVEGRSNKYIAVEMELAEATVKMHITAIFKRLGVDNRTQAALAAQKLGIYTD